MFTGATYVAPAEPTVLAKHTAKTEKVTQEKGNLNADISSLSSLSPQDIYSGYLNRLHSSRDYEASLVNLMREKYEVNFPVLTLLFSTYLYLITAPKFRFICFIVGDLELL